MLEYARSGRVINGWEYLSEDDPQFEDGSDNIYPLYDETNLSSDPWYPLAQTLDTIGAFEHYRMNEACGLLIHAMAYNDGLAIDTAKQLGLALSLAP